MLRCMIHQTDMQSKGRRETNTRESQDMQGIMRAPGSGETSTRAGNSLHPAQQTLTQHGQKYKPTLTLQQAPWNAVPWKQAKWNAKTSVHSNATSAMLNGRNKRLKHLPENTN